MAFMRLAGQKLKQRNIARRAAQDRDALAVVQSAAAVSAKDLGHTQMRSRRVSALLIVLFDGLIASLMSLLSVALGTYFTALVAEKQQLDAAELASDERGRRVLEASAHTFETLQDIATDFLPQGGLALLALLALRALAEPRS